MYRGFNKILIISTVLLGMSVLWDVCVLIYRWPNKTHLTNYIDFEKEVIDKQKKILLNRIKTSIEFKNKEEREKLASLLSLESMTLPELEEKILSMHQVIKTLDSLQYGVYDIVEFRRLRNESKNKDIKIFYEQLMTFSIFERIASDVFDDSDFGLTNWTIIRPKTEDSTYIGAQFYPDGLSKYAYFINGKYFRGLYDGGLYTVKRADTVNIKTLYIINKGTYIDTQFNNQRIVLTGTEWKNIGM